FEPVRVERAEVVVGLDKLDLRVVAELREHLDQLELVEKVVLEPEDDGASSAEQLVATLQLREDYVLRPPPELGEEAGSKRARLGWIDGDGPDVEGVVPREDDSLERRRSQRARHGLAVRHVQRAAREVGVPPAAREIGSGRGAVGDGVPDLVLRANKRGAHRSERGHLRVDRVELSGQASARSRRGGGRIAACQAEVLADLRQREAEALRLLEGAHEPNGVGPVLPLTAWAARRLRKETAPLVVAQRLDVHARLSRHLTSSHDPTVDPYLGTECNSAQYAASSHVSSFWRTSRRNRPASAPSTSR